MKKYLYRASLDDGELYFERYAVVRETKRTYFINYKGKEKRVLKPYSKTSKIRKAFVRNTKVEAFNDLYIRTQIHLALLKKRTKYVEEDLNMLKLVIKSFDIGEIEKPYEKNAINLNSENIQNMEENILDEFQAFCWSLNENNIHEGEKK